MSGLEPIVPSLTIPRSLDLSRRQPRAHAFGGPGGQVVSIDPDRAAWGERPAVQGTLRQAAGLAMYAGKKKAWKTAAIGGPVQQPSNWFRATTPKSRSFSILWPTPLEGPPTPKSPYPKPNLTPHQLMYSRYESQISGPMTILPHMSVMVTLVSFCTRRASNSIWARLELRIAWARSILVPKQVTCRLLWFSRSGVLGA